MITIETSIKINSSIEKAWSILTNFDAYDTWNPFMRIKGIPEKGEKLYLMISLDGSNFQSFQPIVQESSPPKSFKWIGKLLFKGLFYGEHYFYLETLNNENILLVHGEHFSGILSPLVLHFIKVKTKLKFEEMNEALKKQCETT